MAQIMNNLIRIVVVLCSIQLCTAQDSFYWYSSWYIWFAVTMLTTICCGVLGSYLRRRQIQKALRSQRSVILAVQSNDQGQPSVSPPGVAIYPPPVFPSDGAAPYNQPMPNSAITPPPYDQVVDRETKLATLPPSYQEAIRSQSGYINYAATNEDNGQEPADNSRQLSTVSGTVDSVSNNRDTASALPVAANAQTMTQKSTPSTDSAHPSTARR